MSLLHRASYVNIYPSGHHILVDRKVVRRGLLYVYIYKNIYISDYGHRRELELLREVL